MIFLENDTIKVKIGHRGAELQSLYSKENNIEYLWQADPEYWAKHSPVLFPIVGALKEDTYKYKNNSYKLSRHGFAREIEFLAEEITENSATFSLSSNDDTKSVYPFEFVLKITYQLKKEGLKVTYEVHNPSQDVLLFSVGAHPAFNVPLTKGTLYEDYYLEFAETETAPRWKITGNLIGTSTEPFLQNSQRVPLTKELFYGDAVVLKDLKSDYVSILSYKTTHGIKFSIKGFPYLGIWAAKDAPFVCIEPWCGIADSVDHTQLLEEKEGIIRLEKGESWTRSWEVEIF